MAVTHLLDTSVYSHPIRKKAKQIQTVIDRWQALGDTSLVTCVICEAELLFGIHKEKRDYPDSKIFATYETLLKGKLDILPMDAAAAAAYAELRCDCEARSKPVADMDLLIASVAKANNLIVATPNIKDFSVLNGIKVEDWSQPLPP